MGYNTAVLILNDAASGLRDDPNVGTKLYDAIGRATYPDGLTGEYASDFSIGNHANGGRVLASRHADDTQIVAIGQNSIRSVANLYHLDMHNDIEVLEALAERLGYRVVKKPEKA